MTYAGTRRVVDADSHLMEWPTFLTDHADPRVRDQLPVLPRIPGVARDGADHTDERASHDIPAAKRVRKLLLHRAEIDKLYGETQVGGRALVLLNLHWKNGKLKAELGVAQGKVARDKRADLKKRAIDRETAREVARFNRKHAG